MVIGDYLSYLNPANLNIFGVDNPNYAGLLEPQDAAALSKRSNIAGLLGTAAAIAQGMGSQGPKRSATQNILSARRDPTKQEAALRSVEKLRERQASLLVGDVDIRDRMTKAPEGFKPQYKTIADLKEAGVLKGKELLDAIQKVDTAVQESSKQYRYDGITGQYAYQMFGTNDATKLSPEQNRNILAYANAPTQADQTKIAIDAQKLQFETGKAPALPMSREQFIQGQVTAPAPMEGQTAPRIRGPLEPMAQPPAPMVAPELQRAAEIPIAQPQAVAPTIRQPQVQPQAVAPTIRQPQAVTPSVQPTTPQAPQAPAPQAPKAKPAVDIGKVTPLVQQPDAKVPPKEKQKIIAAQPATIALVNYTATQLVDARDAAQALLNSPKELKAISGVTGPTMAKVPGTDAFTGAAKLENLQTRSFVSEIQKMRAASPTGGAVGSVTEKEMGALSNIQASLKAGLKETELRKQLQQYINSANRALKTIPNEYARTYGYNGEFDEILKGGVVQKQPSGLPRGVTVKRK